MKISDWSNQGMGLCNRLYFFLALIAYKQRFLTCELYSYGKFPIMWTNGLCSGDIRDVYQSDLLNFISDDEIDRSSFHKVSLSCSSITSEYQSDTEFVGWFFSDHNILKYFDKDLTRKIFKPDHLVSEVYKKYNHIFNNSFYKIGMSIRRGDFVTGKYDWIGDFFKNNNDMNYYIGRVKHLTSINPNSLIVVVSDDIKWCMDNLTPLYPNMEFLDTRGEKYKAFYDLTALGMCQDVIMTPGSTFSRWGYLLTDNGCFAI